MIGRIGEHSLRRSVCYVLVTVKGGETCVPRYLGQVVLVRVVEVESTAERAAGRRRADIRAVTAVVARAILVLVLSAGGERERREGKCLHSRPAVEIIAVRRKCSRVLEECFGHVVAFVESVCLVVADACRIDSLAEKDLFVAETNWISCHVEWEAELRLGMSPRFMRDNNTQGTGLTPPTARLAVIGLGRADTQVAAAMIVVMRPDNCILATG